MDCFTEMKMQALKKSAQEGGGMPPERMVLGDKKNLAAPSSSSFSEVRISEFQEKISLFLFIWIRNFHLKMILISF